jgi:DNA ligase-associated metallophosphoesterase
VSDDVRRLGPLPEPLRGSPGTTPKRTVSSPAERSEGKGTQAGYRLDPRMRGDERRSRLAPGDAARSARPRECGDPDFPAVRGTGIVTEPTLTVSGITFLALREGALFWPEERLLVVADLHLEKGSSYAARGVPLPPYDTAVTLARLAALVARLAPRTIVALGDTFHDSRAYLRISPADRTSFLAIARGKDFVAVAGNHDPAPFPGLVERPVEEFRLGPLVFRHEPSAGPATGEIAGHLHPAARVVGRGGSVRRRCFAGDGFRAVLPAFGAYAGGLNVREPALAGLFDSARFAAHVLGQTRVYAVAPSRLRDG